MSKKLFEKEKAPTFKLKRDGNNYIDTSTLKNPYIVYFYPKDDTPGCTIEAIDFSSNMKFFNQNNITIIGISKDTVEKHEKFISKHDLKIILGSDINGEVCDKYGVWVEKSMYDRKYMGIERSTFLIDSKNNIFKIWKKVKVKGHVEEVIKFSQDMLDIS